jgi:non-heme chloroperoxidase
MRNGLSICVLMIASILGLSASRAEDWHDPSPHQIRFVTVQPGVKIETLDWGGTGRPLILIAGAGGTAHTFDDFALLLAPHFHVYGVTRRGYGDSSRPRNGYDADRLGDDVVAVIRTLNIKRPILMGHSFGGQEVSDVATRYPTLIAGAIYLDAVYSYDAAAEKEALYWNVEWKQQIETLQKHLAALLESPFDSRALARALSDQDLPTVQKIAENLVRVEKGRPPWLRPTSPISMGGSNGVLRVSSPTLRTDA